MKKLFCQKIRDKKNQRCFDPKILDPIKCGPKNGSKTILGLERFWDQKDFGSKNILDSKSFWVHNNFKFMKILGPKNILVHRVFCFGPNYGKYLKSKAGVNHISNLLHN